jgi:hypothetical protein
MAIQWADDFSRYGTGNNSRLAMLEGLPYASLGNGDVVSSPDPNDSGRAFLLAAATNNPTVDFRVALPNIVSGIVGTCSRIWLSNLPITQAANLIGYLRADANYLCYAQLQLNGSIKIFGLVGGTLVQVADTVNPVINPSSFNHYEFIHDKAAGTGELRINGALTLSYTGVDTAHNIAFVSIGNRAGVGTGPATYIKDLFIWDGTGSENNSVAGTVIVRRYKPNGDVTLGGWASTGASATAVLAKDAPNDSTYVSAEDSPLPAPLIVNVENLPPDITSIRGLIAVTRSRKIDGGDGNIQSALSPDEINWDTGASRPITTAFSYDFDVSELDPATAAAWTPVAVDNVKLRVDRTV